MSKRKRRTYTDEFKAEAVKLVTEQGYSVAVAARNLGVSANSLRNWKQKLKSVNEDETMTEDEQMELARLRKEVRRLRMERDILKKATAFFVNGAEWFYAASVLLTSNIVNFFTKSSDQRERAKRFRAIARLGWRMCRPVNLAVNDEANTEIFPPAIVMHTPSIHPPMAVIAF